MKNYHSIKNIKFVEKSLLITIDGKDYKFPLKLISDKLSNAKPEQLNNYKISPSGYGIHWPLLDEDISIDGLLKLKQSTVKTHKKNHLHRNFNYLLFFLPQQIVVIHNQIYLALLLLLSAFFFF